MCLEDPYTGPADPTRSSSPNKQEDKKLEHLTKQDKIDHEWHCTVKLDNYLQVQLLKL